MYDYIYKQLLKTTLLGMMLSIWLLSGICGVRLNLSIQKITTTVVYDARRRM